MKGNFSRISLPQNGVVAVSLYGHACRLSQGLFNTSFVFCFGQALPLCPSRALLGLSCRPPPPLAPPPPAPSPPSPLTSTMDGDAIVWVARLCAQACGAVIARVNRSAFQQ